MEVAFWHLKFLSLDLAYTTSITLREPGWRCTTLALSSAKSVGGTEGLVGPARCQSLLPITTLNGWIWMWFGMDFG